MQGRGALVECLTVTPGDLVVGDAEGVIAVPQQLVGERAAKVSGVVEVGDWGAQRSSTVCRRGGVGEVRKFVSLDLAPGVGRANH